MLFKLLKISKFKASIKIQKIVKKVNKKGSFCENSFELFSQNVLF